MHTRLCCKLTEGKRPGGSKCRGCVLHSGGNSSVGRNHPSQHKVFNLGIQLPNNSISEELSRPPALLRGRRRSKKTDTGLRLHCSSASPSEWLPGQLPIGRRPESRHPVCRSGCWRRRPQWCGSSTGKQTLAQSPAAWPRAHRPLARLRYLLCEVVSDDPRCRLSLEDRVLGGLVRDTIARVHGTFGAAACSIGFAGARVLGNRGLAGRGGSSGQRREKEGAQATPATAKPCAQSYVRYNPLGLCWRSSG